MVYIENMYTLNLNVTGSIEFHIGCDYYVTVMAFYDLTHTNVFIKCFIPM